MAYRGKVLLSTTCQYIRSTFVLKHAILVQSDIYCYNTNRSKEEWLYWMHIFDNRSTAKKITLCACKMLSCLNLWSWYKIIKCQTGTNKYVHTHYMCRENCGRVYIEYYM